jgi:hypothetical protein
MERPHRDSLASLTPAAEKAAAGHSNYAKNRSQAAPPPILDTLFEPALKAFPVSGLQCLNLPMNHARNPKLHQHSLHSMNEPPGNESPETQLLIWMVPPPCLIHSLNVSSIINRFFLKFGAGLDTIVKLNSP